MQTDKIILGIDPGTTIMGYGLIHIKGNKMIDIQITNKKLEDRACRIIQESLKVSYIEAYNLLKKHKSIRDVFKSKKINE